MGVGNIVIGSHKADFCFAQSFCNVHTLRYGLKSGPVRRASTGISPLLRSWLPSPEVAVKGLAVRGKSVHQSHRVATLFDDDFFEVCDVVGSRVETRLRSSRVGAQGFRPADPWLAPRWSTSIHLRREGCARWPLRRT